MKLWYAIMLNDDDNDWGTGSYNKEEAIQMVMKYHSDGNTDAYIAVIDDGNDPVCVGEIREFQQTER